MTSPRECAHLSELRELSHRIDPVLAFLLANKHEDVAAGALRVWNPPFNCPDCGGLNDITGEISCPCWEPVNEEIARELEDLGIERRHNSD